jgi:hypothetical protein
MPDYRICIIRLWFCAIVGCSLCIVFPPLWMAWFAGLHLMPIGLMMPAFSLFNCPAVCSSTPGEISMTLFGLTNATCSHCAEYNVTIVCQWVSPCVYEGLLPNVANGCPNGSTQGIFFRVTLSERTEIGFNFHTLRIVGYAASFSVDPSEPGSESGAGEGTYAINTAINTPTNCTSLSTQTLTLGSWASYFGQCVWTSSYVEVVPS